MYDRYTGGILSVYECTCIMHMGSLLGPYMDRAYPYSIPTADTLPILWAYGLLAYIYYMVDNQSRSVFPRVAYLVGGLGHGPLWSEKNHFWPYL